MNEVKNPHGDGKHDPRMLTALLAQRGQAENQVEDLGEVSPENEAQASKCLDRRFRHMRAKNMKTKQTKKTIMKFNERKFVQEIHSSDVNNRYSQ